ncbi:response regulator [Variovorax sp. HW608]|uniref:response regulator n=1 Tax=Variovorax sp. HW608 TaxID=1034889 RepID=UPI0022B262ED|nr:response regulator [Variovorax sp. HW608]
MACILLDVQMPGVSGPQLQQRLLERGDAPPVIFITGRGDLSAGVDAMKLGAGDFLEKPVDGEVPLAAVRRRPPAPTPAAREKAIGVAERGEAQQPVRAAERRHLDFIIHYSLL